MEITRIGAILFLVLTPTYNFRIALVIPAETVEKPSINDFAIHKYLKSL